MGHRYEDITLSRDRTADDTCQAFCKSHSTARDHNVGVGRFSEVIACEGVVGDGVQPAQMTPARQVHGRT